MSLLDLLLNINFAIVLLWQTYESSILEKKMYCILEIFFHIWYEIPLYMFIPPFIDSTYTTFLLTNCAIATLVECVKDRYNS